MNRARKLLAAILANPKGCGLTMPAGRRNYSVSSTRAVRYRTGHSPGPTKYPIEVFWSDEDEGFIAVVPDLPGCSAWGAA